ncbi:MAG: S-methyl-5'-thioinosine phosphorylase [Acidimicrobiia bacterium]|nr:S-methyl-5'-thioinosine phosphorylase [Actinomycetota bacterium]MBL6924169.1 S-methyl-5'-thioinosine phosphorylase [Acidimicrobiia bacterium]MBL6927026.1 S-methyl-5'-thioinosine phosphorylase [Acidimicrobiia bacterium]
MLGLITGSGFYDLPGLVGAREQEASTPYGSVGLVSGTWMGCPVVFLPRHGADHSVPPQRIPYRANLWALHDAGARAVFATAVSGGINPAYRNGELVLIDQFINLTHGREDTFFDDEVRHTDMTDPYDPDLRRLLAEVAGSAGVRLVDGGTYVCANGPRFETPAEIRMYAGFGGDLVGMTGYPEVALARELDLPYAAVGVVSNPAAGLGSEDLSLEDIFAVLEDAVEPLLCLLGGAAERLAQRWA